jgi:hypothetical protein
LTTFSKLFGIEEISSLEITSRFFKNEIFDKEKKFKYAKLNLVFKGENINLKGMVKPRGNNRWRDCKIPPLKLRSSKGYFNDVKLYLVCNDSKKELLREYFAYKFLNILGVESFSVKLFPLKLIDEKKGPVYSGHAFILGPVKRFAKRKNLIRYKKLDYSLGLDENLLFGPTKLVPFENYMKAVLMNSLIKNRDWKLYSNTYLFRDKLKNLIIVPYDFDYSGMVLDKMNGKNYISGDWYAKTFYYHPKFLEILPNLGAFGYDKESFKREFIKLSKNFLTREKEIRNFYKVFRSKYSFDENLNVKKIIDHNFHQLKLAVRKDFEFLNIKSLLSELDSKDYFTRVGVVYLLGKLRVLWAVPHLIKKYSRKTPKEFQKMVHLALSEIGGRKACKFLFAERMNIDPKIYPIIFNNLRNDYNDYAGKLFNYFYTNEKSPASFKQAILYTQRINEKKN